MKPLPSPRRQRGVVLLFALIALLVLMVGAAALVRSFNSSLFQAGNIGFKRDLQNRGDIAATLAMASFKSGVLQTSVQRASSTVVNADKINYSAILLSADPQGIPDVLTRADGTDQITPGFVLNTTANRVFTDSGKSVFIDYVVERLCASTGDEKTLGVGQCALAAPPTLGADQTGSADSKARCAGCKSSAAQLTLYRLTAKVTGPRGTQSFFQSTFSVPS